MAATALPRRRRGGRQALAEPAIPSPGDDDLSADTQGEVDATSLDAGGTHEEDLEPEPEE